MTPPGQFVFRITVKTIPLPPCWICFNIVPYSFVVSLISDDVVVKRGLPYSASGINEVNLVCDMGFVLSDNGRQIDILFIQNENTMHMIGHDNKFIYLYSGKMLWDIFKTSLCNFTKLVQLRTGLGEQATLFPGADRHKVVVWRGVIKKLQSGTFPGWEAIKIVA